MHILKGRYGRWTSVSVRETAYEAAQCPKQYIDFCQCQYTIPFSTATAAGERGRSRRARHRAFVDRRPSLKSDGPPAFSRGRSGRRSGPTMTDGICPLQVARMNGILFSVVADLEVRVGVFAIHPPCFTLLLFWWYSVVLMCRCVVMYLRCCCFCSSFRVVCRS